MSKTSRTHQAVSYYLGSQRFSYDLDSIVQYLLDHRMKPTQRNIEFVAADYYYEHGRQEQLFNGYLAEYR